MLARVDPKDYLFIVVARENKEPSEGDLTSLIDVVERVSESGP